MDSEATRRFSSSALGLASEENNGGFKRDASRVMAGFTVSDCCVLKKKKEKKSL